MCLKLNPFQEELTLRVDISNVRVDVPRKTKKYGSHARFSPALGLSSATMPLQLSGSQNLNTKPHKTKPHKTWSGPVFRVGGRQAPGPGPPALRPPRPPAPVPPWTSLRSFCLGQKKKKSCVKKKKKKITSELFLARAPLVLLSDFSLARARKLLAGGGLC